MDGKFYAFLPSQPVGPALRSTWRQRTSLSATNRTTAGRYDYCSRRPIKAEASVSQTVERALRNEFRGKNISRVLTSFERVVQGEVHEVDKDSPSHQRAVSFVEGLDSKPFYDDFSKDFEWANHLEANWETIAKEVMDVTSRKGIEEEGNNIWAPPVVDAARAYGPDWRTLVLKNRVWDPTNTKLFPKTAHILQDEEANVPAVEAFFARQAPDTGIKLHTDDCNFILTMHLGLRVPVEKSWIEVAGERRFWENGRALIFNTSYYHQTKNESTDEDRLVLLVRFWHPGLTEVERDALDFLFAAIDDPDSHPAVVEAANQLRREERKGLGRVKRKSKTAGFGFGS